VAGSGSRPLTIHKCTVDVHINLSKCLFHADTEEPADYAANRCNCAQHSLRSIVQSPQPELVIEDHPTRSRKFPAKCYVSKSQKCEKLVFLSYQCGDCGEWTIDAQSVP
jgi:hypothetical protein